MPLMRYESKKRSFEVRFDLRSAILKYRLLGPIEAHHDGQTLDLGTYKQRALLALLLIHANAVVSTDRIIDELWGDDPGRDRQNTLWVNVSGLRSALEPDREKRTEGSILLTRSPGYVIAVDSDNVDAARFEQLAIEGRALLDVDPGAASLVLSEALALWRGHALEEFTYESFAQAEIARLEELRLTTVEDRVGADLRVGRSRELVGELESLVRQHPLREQLTGHLMVALHRSGRQAEALLAFGALKTRLGEELGLEPSAEITKLEERIVLDDPTLRQPEAALVAGGRSEPGLSVRGYELREKIGEGAHGYVYRAYQPALGREVAIKVIRPELANNPDFIRRFESETHLVAGLEHPQMVPLFDYWREPDSAFLVMRHFERGSLQDELDAGPLSTEMVVRVIGQVGAALSAAHRRGVTHGDIKPTNIMIDGDGNAFLADFGMSLGQRDQSEAGVLGSSLQALFAAPEQLRSDEITARSDLYSLAVVADLTLRGATGEGRRPDSPLVGPAADVIARATAESPGDRFPDVESFVEELGIALGGTALLETKPLLDVENPYRGLRAFEEGDANRFFGRERLIERLVARLGHSGPQGKLLALVGPSGAGKSSVVRAGLIPALRRGALPGSDRWFVVTMTPGSHPFEALEDALLKVAVDPPAGLMEELTSSGISEAVQSLLPETGSQLLLIVDQLEELFSHASPPAASAFLTAMADAASNRHSSVKVVATLRADFYDHPLRHEAFGELLRLGTEVITPMTAEELERAVAAPAAEVGVSYEPGLVAQIVSDMAGQSAALPLMQYALTELFEQRTGATISTDSYRALGGISAALVRRADSLYEGLDADAKTSTRDVFLRLVTLGEGSEDTRRRSLQSELTDGRGDGAASVLSTFGRHRLLSFDRDPVTRGPTVEIAHEALLTEWNRLSQWIGDARTDVGAQRRLAAAAADWRARDNNPDFLLTGAHYKRYGGWLENPPVRLTEAEGQFLDASASAQAKADEAAREARVEGERQRVRRRVLAVLAAVAGLVGVVAVVFAIFAQQRASDESSAADFAQLISRSTDLQTTQTDLALLLAAEAYAQNPGIESQRALLGALQNVEGTVEVWEAPRFPFRSFFPLDPSLGGCFRIMGSGQFVTQPNSFSGGTPDPGGIIVDIDVINRTVHRLESSRLECHVSRSPRDGSDSWLYVGSDNSPTTIVVSSDGTEVGSYAGFVRPFFDAQGRLLAKSGDLETVSEYVELDPLTGDVLSETLFEANWATATNGGKFISVIFERMDGAVPDPSALLDADTYEVAVDLSTETGRAISGRTSADDSRFGYVSKDDRLLVWNTDSGEVAVDTPVTENAQAIAFSPDGSSIVLLVDDEVLQIRSGIDGQITRTIDVGREPVMAIDWAQDHRIAVLRSSGVVDLVSTRGGGLYETGPPCCNRNEFGFFVADGIPNAYAVTGNFDTGVHTYVDVVTGEEFRVDVAPWVFEEFGAHALFARDKTTVLIRPPFEMIHVELDGTAGEPRYPFGDRFVTLEEVPDHVSYAQRGGDEWVFLKLTGGSISDREVVLEELQIGVINIDTMEMVVEPNLIDLRAESPKVSGAQLIPGGILVVDQFLDDGQVRQQYFTADGERFLEFFVHEDVGWELMTPDRRYILTVNKSTDVVQRWDVETGESIDLPLAGTPQRPDMLSDGRFMIQTRSGQYELWDIEAGAAIGVLADAGPGAFTDPAVHPDESHVWIRLDGTWTKISLDPQRWFELACEFAGRSLTEAEWRELVSSDRPHRNACPATT